MTSGPRASDAHEDLADHDGNPIPARRTPEPASMPEGDAEVKSCGGGAPYGHNSAMRPSPSRPKALPLRPQDETQCSRCDVHCDKVVYPAACLERSCPFVVRVRGVRPHVRRLHAEGLRVRDRPRTCCSPPSGPRGLRRGAGDAKAAADVPGRGRRRATSAAQSELGCVNPEFFELPRRRARLPRARPGQLVDPHVQRACSSRSAVTSAASGPRPAAPASRSPPAGPAAAGAPMKTPSRSPISPARTPSCRSRFDPSGAFESLMCRSAQAVEADLLVDLLQQPVELLAVGDVVARRVEVARVEAEAEPRVPAQPIDDRRRARRPSDRSCRRRRRCSRSGATSVRARLERGLERGRDAVERSPRARRRGASRCGSRRPRRRSRSPSRPSGRSAVVALLVEVRVRSLARLRR